MPKDYNNNDNYKNGIKKPPEKKVNRAENTLIEPEIIQFPNGEEHVYKKTGLEKNESGQWERVTRVYPIQDSSGRFIPPEMIAGVSWTGLAIPADHFVACRNPWEDHYHRLVYLNQDGFETEFGNILCSECYEKNKKKDQLKKWIGWFYEPEIF